MLAIRLPEEIESRLEHLAQATGRTKTFYAREAIERYIEDLEDIYLAEEISRRIDQGIERLYTLEEMRQALGLED